MSWRDNYNEVGIKPGEIATRQHGIVDLSRDNLPLNLIDKLYAENCPYLEKIQADEKSSKTTKTTKTAKTEEAGKTQKPGTGSTES
jgi:hypothetical protein